MYDARTVEFRLLRGVVSDIKPGRISRWLHSQMHVHRGSLGIIDTCVLLSFPSDRHNTRSKEEAQLDGQNVGHEQTIKPEGKYHSAGGDCFVRQDEQLIAYYIPSPYSSTALASAPRSSKRAMQLS